MIKRIALIISLGLVLTAGIIFAAARTERISPQIDEVLQAGESSLTEESPPPEEIVPSRGELIIKALARAYPGRVIRHEFRNEDWALYMDGIWYYYAGGRMLPEVHLENADEYSGSFNIPNYQKDLPPWTEPTPEQAARFSGANRGNNRERQNSDRPRVQRRRQYYFHEGLWRAGSREDVSRRVTTINFFNYRLTIHSDLVEILSLIENRVIDIAKTDQEVSSWVNGIGEVHGWSWRTVAGSAARSYHSYGIAVDILPKNLYGKETYWQWAAGRGKEWWNIPYEDRYHPPDKVVKTFEAYGFMWGGKWQRFDTMHFEYRPEVLILSGLEVETSR